MEQAQLIGDLWRMFLRRLPILVGVGLIGILASGFFAYILPPVFQSEAKILVESQQIPDDLARSTVTASASERLQIIQQRLMTRDNLIRLIDEHDLYADRADMTITQKVNLLRQATIIQPIALSGQRGRNGSLSAFTIRVIFNDPLNAARIANEFVTTVLEQNLRTRAERATETLEFFDKEEQRLASELVALEAQIQEFKRDNDKSLPESLDFRREELSRLNQSEFELDQRMLELAERRTALGSALEQAVVVQVQAPARSQEELRLRQLQAELAQKRAVYAESHREIRAIQTQISALQSVMPVSASSTADDGESPLQSAQQSGLRAQIAEVDKQIALLRDRKESLDVERVAIQETIAKTPGVEINLNAFYRRHAELQDRYGVIARKRTEAETGEKLEVNQQAERFEVIENAIPSDRPISPNRKKIVIMGSAASLALAGALAFLLELMRPALRTAGQMQRQLDLRPVISIPYIRTRRERRRRLAWILGFLIVVVIGIPAALFAIDQYYLPLQLIAERLAEKSGLGEVIRLIEARF